MTTAEAREAYRIAYEAWVKARQDSASTATTIKLYSEARKAQLKLNSLLKGGGKE